MTLEPLKSFVEKVTVASLQDMFKAAASSYAVLKIAKEAGFSIFVDDLKQTQPTKLSTEELEGVVGGGRCVWRTVTNAIGENNRCFVIA